MHTRLSRSPYIPGRCKLADAAETARQLRAMRAVLGATALGVGGGAAARGLLGLAHAALGGMPLEESPSQPRLLEVPVVRQTPAEEDAPRGAPRFSIGRAPVPPRLPAPALKFAAAPPSLLHHLEQLASVLAKRADATTGTPPAASSPPAGGLASQVGAFFKRHADAAATAAAPYLPSTTGASNPAASAAYLPLTLGGGIAGAAGGWSLVNWLLDRRRQAEMARQLDAAKVDYRQALDEQYATMLPAKQASHGSLAEVAAVWEKCGWEWPSWLPRINPKGLTGYQSGVDTANVATGAYLAAMGLTALGSGVGTYEWAKSRGQSAALAEALRRRRQEYAGRPAPVLAVAKAVDPDEFERA